ALVIGDPGDPNQGHNLPGAMEEALRVQRVLEARGVEVHLRVGSPNTPRQGKLRGVKPATRMETLHFLMKGGFDILHYSGHGDFIPESPDRAGWVFTEGLLTSREIERMENAPALVFANACLSPRTSETTEAGQGITKSGKESALLPSLVDEFFHKGVRNYVGTAWEVSDVGAILFAEVFYETLLNPETRTSIGEAVQGAREALYSQSRLYGQLWAAYQHYGDPTSSLRTAQDMRDPQ
ncbi:MAG: CHAT domain-containing protein, partial [Syntrophobacteraceae bacterium]|nr:CHAT domain-containing protein [Syntrophobacteraceae bacterium]